MITLRAILQLLFIGASVLVIASGFDVSISPPAAQLENIKAGENLLLSCSVSGVSDEDAIVNIEWYKDSDSGEPFGTTGRIMTITTPKRNSRGLMIITTTINDAATYICKATANDEHKSASVVVSFIQTAKFVDAPTEQHPQDGKDARITCRVESSPQAEIVWSYRGTTIDQDKNTRGYYFEEDNQVLVIPRFVTDEDDGIYSCNVFVLTQFTDRQINVTAYVGPNISVFSDEQMQVYEGKSLRLICIATGKPEPQYKWQKGSPSDDISKRQQIANSSDKYHLDNGILVIEDVISDDAGVYTCFASNAVGATHKSTSITVFRKPRIEKMPNQMVAQAANVEFVCKYSGDGQITAKWLAKGIEVHSDEMTPKETTIGSDISDYGSDSEDYQLRRRRQVDHHHHQLHDERMSVRRGDDGNSLILTISSVTLDDAGTYQCQTENVAGTEISSTYLAVTHQPIMLRKMEYLVRSFNGNKVSMFCVVAAVPPPAWTWTTTSNGATIVADIDHYFINTTDDSLISTLTVKTTVASDYDEYECVANNNIGLPAKALFRIMEIFQPSTPENINCSTNNYPNYGLCAVTSDADIAHQPVDLYFYVKSAEIVDDWNTITPIVLSFAHEYRLPNLQPNAKYLVRAQARNEAGMSEMSDESILETSLPWAPEVPAEVSADCTDICVIRWSEPNDHGSRIINYVATANQFIGDGDERKFIGEEMQFQVPHDQLSMELGDLQPLCNYVVKLYAVNAVGRSHPFEIIAHTADYTPMSSTKTNLSIPAIIGIVAAILIFLLVIVDVTCYSLNRCGVVACFCVNCLGRTPREEKAREMTVEEGGGARPESAQLLAGKHADDATALRRENY